jgi:DnaK suppressor protein
MDLNHIEARIQEELSHTLVNIDDIREQLSQTAVQSSDCCDTADQLQHHYQLNTTIRRLNKRVNALTIAKAKLSLDDYGYCQACGEDIEPARLAFDATYTHCISCQTTKEMNEHLYR